HTTERQLEEHGDKVDAGLKSEIEAAVAEAKTAVEGGDPAAMTEKSQALAQVAMKLGQAIYEKEQQAAASPAADAGETKADEDVVDAEFSEVEDDKK
ncbi:MAG TPA: molecular chaperone DnaK, partial [Sphingopyxis sp.]|nr:molecular chaperone DnaK [Sphingopyxis sp.]